MEGSLEVQGGTNQGENQREKSDDGSHDRIHDALGLGTHDEEGLGTHDEEGLTRLLAAALGETDEAEGFEWPKTGTSLLHKIELVHVIVFLGTIIYYLSKLN